ncbi:MAG: hypothetical protein ACRDPA_34360 [Solirubrobacteraceae bacterium]
MVAFSSASAAVGCAVLMQQVFERRYRQAEQRLPVRIGLGAGESTIQEFESVGELELKGFSDPVEVYVVSWAPVADEGEAPGGWPLPAVLRAAPRFSYVGREAHRDGLAVCWGTSNEDVGAPYEPWIDVCTPAGVDLAD